MGREDIRKIYYDFCRNESEKGLRAQLLPIRSGFSFWTSIGTIDSFMWKALTTVYDPSMHKMDETKRAYNKFHRECRDKGGYSIFNLLVKAMNNDPTLSWIMEDMFVVNTDVLPLGQNSEVLNSFICGLKQCSPPWYDRLEALFVKDDRVGVNFGNIVGKNLAFPLLLATEQSLKYFSQWAKLFIKGGAATCSAICFTRLVPNEKGECPTNLSPEMDLPVIYGLSLMEWLNLLDDEDEQ